MYQHIEQENQYRNNIGQLTDDKLIRLDKTHNVERLPSNEKLLAPSNSKLNMINLSEFQKRFYQATGGGCSYLDWNHIVAAGGSVSNSLNGLLRNKKQMETDCDLFIYGCDESKAKEVIENTVNNIVQYYNDNSSFKKNLFFKSKYGRKLLASKAENAKKSKESESDSDSTSSTDSDKEESGPNSSCVVVRNNYTINIIPHDLNKRKHKVQIILRLYKSIYEILAGFDVDSCCTAYDGSTVYLTPRSVNAFKFGYNIVDLSRRSPSYEHRLFKYHQRGFGIMVPFDYHGYNQLYFMNRYSRGLDRLMYLLKSKDEYKLQQFMNRVTGRLAILMKSNVSSNYQTDVELNEHARNLMSSIMKYNRNVSTEFKYKLYSKTELDEIKFMVENPSSQLTGSFNPITDVDWIKVDYLKESNCDHLGRNESSLLIKTNKYNMGQLFSKVILDVSYLDQIAQLIIYSSNEDDIIKAYDNRSILSNRIRNKYNIDYEVLAVLMNRQRFINYVVSKLVDQKSTDMDRQLMQIVNAIVMMDNASMLNMIEKIPQCQQHRSMKRSSLKDLSILYKSSDIKNYLLIDDQPNQTNKKSANTLLQMSDDERFDYIQSENILDENWSNELIMKLTSEEWLTLVNKHGKSLINTLKPFIKLEVVDRSMSYTQLDLFEQTLLEMLVNLEYDKQSKKSDSVYHVLHWVLTHFYELEYGELNDIITVSINLKSIHKYKPSDLRLMREIFETGKLNSKHFVNLWENSDIRIFVFNTDKLEVIKQLIDEKYMLKFLSMHESEIKPESSIGRYYFEFKNKSLICGDIHSKYSSLFKNSASHLKAIYDGILESDYERIENIFGQTPDDYIINGVLNIYYELSKSSNKNELNVDYNYLNNLRKSITQIDLNKNIILSTVDDVIDPHLSELFDEL